MVSKGWNETGNSFSALSRGTRRCVTNSISLFVASSLMSLDSNSAKRIALFGEANARFFRISTTRIRAAGLWQVLRSRWELAEESFKQL